MVSTIVGLLIVFYLMQKVYGTTDTALFVALAVIFGVGAESLGLWTGMYSYGRIFSIPFGATEVPLAISIAWPMVLGASLLLADYITEGPVNRFILMPVIAVGIDFCLFEPLAMQGGLWTWTNPLVPYWVAPWENYVGWLVVAFLTSMMWTILFSPRAREAEAEDVYGRKKKEEAFCPTIPIVERKLVRPKVPADLAKKRKITKIGQIQRLKPGEDALIDRSLALQIYHMAEGTGYRHIQFTGALEMHGHYTEVTHFSEEGFDFNYVFPNGESIDFTIEDVPANVIYAIDGDFQVIHRWHED